MATPVQMTTRKRVRWTDEREHGAGPASGAEPTTSNASSSHRSGAADVDVGPNTSRPASVDAAPAPESSTAGDRRVSPRSASEARNPTRMDDISGMPREGSAADHTTQPSNHALCCDVLARGARHLHAVPVSACTVRAVFRMVVSTQLLRVPRLAPRQSFRCQCMLAM
jgi:hypothetical protein